MGMWWNPVYMRGEDGSDGHAWVCDGYKYIRDMGMATLIPNPKDPRFRLEEKSPNGYMAYGLYINQISANAGEYFHMNFGWGGGSDGWYNRNVY